MYLQLAFNFDDLKIKIKKKRIRYKVPTYKKFYSLYQYDRELFKKLNKARLRGENDLTQEQIVEKCYVRDENGNKIKDSDEKHIFRIKILHKIHELIFNYCGIQPQENAHKVKKYGLVIFPDEMQAEIKNTWQLSINTRLYLHIELLRLLKKNMSIETAVNKIKRNQALSL